MADLNDFIGEFEGRREASSPYTEAMALAVVELRNFVTHEGLLDMAEAQWGVIARIKTAKSVLEKVTRKQLTITSLRELEEKIQDIVGVRVIVHYLSDVWAVEGFIKNKWPRIASSDDYIRIPTEAGYRSLHITAEMDTTNFKDVYVEIQVRTSNEDSWATKTKDLTYKKDISAIPPHLLQLIRLMSNCLNNADEMADTIRQEIARVKQ